MASHAAEVIAVAARALVDQPSEVKVAENVHRGVTVVELTVAPADVGKVIGRQGRTADSLRTLASATAHHHGGKASLDIRGADER